MAKAMLDPRPSSPISYNEWTRSVPSARFRRLILEAALTLEGERRIAAIQPTAGLLEEDLGRGLELRGNDQAGHRRELGGSVKRSPSARSQPRSTSTSSSVKATNSPLASARPRLRAAEMPGRVSRTTRTPGSCDRVGTGGAVVDDDHLEVGVVELDQAAHAAAQLLEPRHRGGDHDRRSR